MDDTPNTPAPVTPDAPVSEPAPKKKKRDKTRDAWFGFILDSQICVRAMRRGQDEVLRDLRGSNPVPPVSLAQWHSTIGERDAALKLLTRDDGAAIAPTPVSVYPLFDGIRGDPRFKELIAQGKL